MFWGLFGRMRRRREEKRKELERIQEEKRAAKEQMMNQAWKDFAEAREAHRQRMYQEDMAALKVTSLDARRDQMQGVLTAKRAYRDDPSRGNYQSDSDIVAAQQFIQSVTESTPVSGCSDNSASSSSNTGSSGDTGTCGATD